jgi:hypothetical protein
MSKRDTFDTGPDIREAIDLTEFTEALVRLANVRFAMSDEYLGTVVTRCRWAFFVCCVSVKQGLLCFAVVFWWCLLLSSCFVSFDVWLCVW